MHPFRIYQKAVICLLLIALVIFSFYFSEKFAAQSDFGYLWAGYDLVRAAVNPYDFKQFDRVQHLILDPSKVSPDVNWYPPLFFLILGPFLAWPYEVAVSLWLLSGIGMLIISGYAAFRFFGCLSDIKPLHLMLGLTMVPVLLCLEVGQIGPLLTLGLIGFFWTIQRKREMLSGCFLLLTLIKPHLFYLVYPVIGIWMIREKKWRVLTSISITLFLAMLATYFLWPPIHAQWLSAACARPPFHWKTDTLVTFTRVFLPGHPAWPIAAIPLISFIATLGYYGYYRKSVSWEKDLPGLLCWSLFTSPHAWIFDHTLLVITQCATICLARRPGISDCARNRLFLALIGYQLFVTVFMVTFLKQGQWTLFWYPLGQWVLWRWALRSTKNNIFFVEVNKNSQQNRK